MSDRAAEAKGGGGKASAPSRLSVRGVGSQVTTIHACCYALRARGCGGIRMPQIPCMMLQLPAELLGGKLTPLWPCRSPQSIIVRMAPQGTRPPTKLPGYTGAGGLPPSHEVLARAQDDDLLRLICL